MAKDSKRNKTVPRNLFAVALKASEKHRDKEDGTVIVTIDMNEVIKFLDRVGYPSKRSTISQRIYKLNKHLKPKLKFAVDSSKRTPQSYDMFLDAFGVE